MIVIQGVYEILGQTSRVYSSRQNKEKSLYKPSYSKTKLMFCGIRAIETKYHNHEWNDQNHHAIVQSRHQQQLCVNAWVGIVSTPA